MRILLVEDDRQLAEALGSALAGSGFTVDWISDGALAESTLRTENFDLLLLDLTLPKVQGHALLSGLRSRKSQIPVLIVSARADVSSAVECLNTGADDYISKPFELAELEARMRALIRRSQGRASEPMTLGCLSLDMSASRVTIRGEVQEFPRRELCLLEILMARLGKVTSKAQIAAQLFSFDDEASPNAIELYVSRLRRRLRPAGIQIRSIRGLGYLLIQ